MKRNIILLAFAAILSMPAMSQALSDKTMTFFGLDFSKSRMSDPGFKDGENLRDHLFVAWNSLFTVEADKYDVGKAFKKDNVTLSLDNVEKHNKAVDTKQLMSSGDYKLSSADAEAVIKSYNTAGKTGLGCVFVVESFNKDKAMGSMYIIFFDMATKKVLLNKYMEGKAGGFGVKNFYAATYRNVINECRSEYPKWLKGK